jgi:hypothetical protein
MHVEAMHLNDNSLFCVLVNLDVRSSLKYIIISGLFTGYFAISETLLTNT